MTSEIRAAIDIGSGSIKVEVFLVECGEESVKIISSLYGREHSVPFGADYKKSPTGELSGEIQEQGLTILKEMIAHVKRTYELAKFSAICTEVFRKAKNGGTFLNRVRIEAGIPVSAVTQAMEAELGFNAVVAVGKLEESKVCVWDSGGASFQISCRSSSTSRSFQSYMGALGTHISTSILIEECRGQTIEESKTVNPVTKEEIPVWIQALQSRMDNVPEFLRCRDTVVAATGQASMFRLCCDCLHFIEKNEVTPNVQIDCMRRDSFTADEARAALNNFLGLTDDEITERIQFPVSADGANLLIPKLTLLCAVMEKTGVKKVQTIDVIGSCAGIAIDNFFWTYQYDSSGEKFNIGDKVQITCSAAGDSFMETATITEHITSSSLCSLFNFVSYFDVYKVKLRPISTPQGDLGNEGKDMIISRNNLMRVLHA